MTAIISSLYEKGTPLSTKEYKAAGGFNALEKALFTLGPEGIIETIKDSNLRGRGGASFPTGMKIQMTAKEKSTPKYIICNADEGEPGTFKDKLLIDGCPMRIIEGMIIAAFSIGSCKGYIYIRGEYRRSSKQIKNVLDILRNEHYLGTNILGSGFDFDIEVRNGAGAYVCGEETALIESIEGNRGESRFKPPYPTSRGLWGKPTLINNVETLANIPVIISMGAYEYKKVGTKGSSGTKLVSVCGRIANRGVYEIEFGTSLRTIIYDLCGGIKGGGKLKFIQLGGSSGPCLPVELLDLKYDYDELKNAGWTLGSGALLAADESVCIPGFVRNSMQFFEHESCGKCTPCREGLPQLLHLLDRITSGKGNAKDLCMISKIAEIVSKASLCGLGQSAPTSVLSTLKYFMDEYEEHLNGYCRAGVCFKGGNTNV